MLITARINEKNHGPDEIEAFLTEKNIRKLGRIKTKYKSPANREKKKVPSNSTKNIYTFKINTKCIKI